MKSKSWSACASLVVLVLSLGGAPAWSSGEHANGPDQLEVKTAGELRTLSLGSSAPFHRTRNEVVDDRLIEVADSAVRVAVWTELKPEGGLESYYAISLDGSSMATVRETSYELKLRHHSFDPGLYIPPVFPGFEANDSTDLYLVQFVTQPLEEYRSAVRSAGGSLHKFIASHAYYVRMTPEVRDTVSALPFVRWVGPVHPEYKLERVIQDQILVDAEVAARRYSIMLHERGPEAQDRVVAVIKSLGAEVHGTTPLGFRVEATMSLDQVRTIARLDDVMFIDRKTDLELDLDIVREIGGADYVEGVAGFTGQGVRAEIADTELDVNHPEWSAPPIIHLAGSGTLHGTSVYGILFAQGVNAQARGIIPDGVGIFAASTTLLGGGPTRYTHTAELVDPQGPYRAVLQTNSTGDGRTFFYTTISAEMDDILFINDITITQSQSNAGNQDSRPQAWAKNIVSGGAVDHFNTLTRDDDCWSCGSGSIGPADDGRIKPDLCFFYDLTLSAQSGGGYTEFGGTSGATPSIAGYFGLFYQMWSEQVFGNEVANPGGTVFENRPHMTTAKAAMINSATQYPFSGQAHDMTRVHQGWGMPSAQYLYDMRDKMGFIDETEVLENLETIAFFVIVEPAEPELRVTMTFADPMGSPAASEARINDLTLKVTSPSLVEYWGNNGLLDGNFSTSGGAASTIDTVENVFVQNPEAGAWTVEVIASEINEDSHVETPEVDADFALVASGGTLVNCTSEGRISLDSSLYACSDQVAIRVVDCDLNTNDTVIDTVTVSIDSTTESGVETVLLTETNALSADFRGTIPVSVVDAVGTLQVSDSDVVTVTYTDADDGMGGTNVPVVANATVDCTPPTITSVAVSTVNPRDATIDVDIDEPAAVTISYGTSCGSLTATASSGDFDTTQQVLVTGLVDDTTYFFAVEAEDEAGNTSTDDNGGSCYTLTTPQVPDFLTEQFTAGLDLEGQSITFTPNGSNDFYGGCPEPLGGSLPTDPVGGTDLGLSDDQPASLSLSGSNSVSLYGQSYSTIWVGPNGYLTFGTGDSTYNESFSAHFSLPRVAALFDDLNPSVGGSVSWKELGDRLAVTWENVPEYSTTNSNTVQIEMFFDGRIRMSWLNVDVSDAVVGLSAGTGLDPDFLVSDLSTLICELTAVFESQQLETDACATGTLGLGNGLWEAGEMVELGVTVRNAGSEPITGAEATVTPLTAGVTMLDATAELGYLAPGATVSTQGSTNAIVQLSETLTCGQMMDFDINVTSNEGNWPDSFQQVVGEVIAERSGVTLSEDFSTWGVNPPAGWTVIDRSMNGTADGFTWFADDTGDPGCGSPNPAAPITGTWAAIDSACTGGGDVMDEQLITPVLDFLGDPIVTLEFDHWFETDTGEIAAVDVRSSATGGAWETVAQWTGASTTQHEIIDITAQAGNQSDVEIRFHYYDAQRELYWYVDNVVVHFFAPEICNMELCSPPVSSPSPVPSMHADRVAVDGSELSVTWDDQCAPATAKIVYGPLDQVSSYTVSGGVCGISTPQSWIGVPAGSLWFVVVSDDGATVESSWGQGTFGERNGLGDSGTCGSTAKDIVGVCP